MLKRPAGRSVVVVVGAVLLVGCGSASRTTTVHSATSSTVPAVSSGSPPLVVCGQTLSTSAAGPVVYDIASHRYPTATGVTLGGVIYVRVSDSCSTGAVVKIIPPTAFATVRTVRATDGRAVLVELRPATKPMATLTAAPAGGHALETLRLHTIAAYLTGPSCNAEPCPTSPPSTAGSTPTSLPAATPRNATGTVAGGIEACSGLPAPTRYVAGTVEAIRGTIGEGTVQQTFPTDVVATQTVAAGGQYRFTLAAGQYVISSVRADPTSDTNASFVSVTVAAGKIIRADTPNDCK